MSQQVYAGTVKVDESIVVKKYTDTSWDLGIAFEMTVVAISESIS
jgi:hypothetical protein